jgi:stage II sporulation SpoM-like protein
MAGNVIRALDRARMPILTIAITYFISVGIGMVMVHARNEWAIAYRDRVVSKAQSSSIIIALDQNDRLRAALLDAAGNLLGAITNTLEGLGVIFPYPFIVYRGWIGGIVSVDSLHRSRLADSKEAAYYLITLTLQLIPSILAGGAGVNIGVANFRPRSFYQGERWLGISKEAIRDAFRIYLVVVPLLLLASLWEFFQR